MADLLAEYDEIICPPMYFTAPGGNDVLAAIPLPDGSADIMWWNSDGQAVHSVSHYSMNTVYDYIRQGVWVKVEKPD